MDKKERTKKEMGKENKIVKEVCDFNLRWWWVGNDGFRKRERVN